MNLIATFLRTAERLGEKTAIVSGNGDRIGFAALAARSSHVAAVWKRLGVRRGDRVLIAMPVDIGLYVSMAALWRLGATIVFPEPAMGLAGLKHALAMTKPKAVLMGGWYRALPVLVPMLWSVPTWLSIEAGEDAREILEPVYPEHPALISFTSGSTGVPKGIERSHGFLAAQNACVAKMLASPNQDERDLVAFPVFVIANLGIGTTSVLPDWKLSRHDKATAEGIAALIDREKITRALVPPLICESLARAGCNPRLGTIFTGGGPIFPDLMRALISTMPQTSVIAVYGSTEAEPIARQAIGEIPAEAWEAMEGGGGLLAGQPVDETRVRIIDDEIIVTGDHVNKSYLDGQGDLDNKILIDGEIWHRTGDAGRIDAQNRLWLRGRLSAKSGAYYPFEIEVAARTWPGVRRVALVPDITPTLLAIEGDEPSTGLWQKKAAEIGTLQIRRVAAIPLDKRHRSKIDYTALRKLVG